MAVATMRELLEAGIHFGHQTRRWHPKMATYIYGQRNGIYIVDLQKTLRQLYRAYGLVRDTVTRGGTILFVGTKRQAQEPVQREAARCGMYYVNNRWLGGTLTNFQTVNGSIQELIGLEALESEGKINQYGKKEGIRLAKRRVKLDKNLCGIKTMPGLPQVMFVIDAKREAIAVREAERLKIPCIGVIDTNCDPDVVSLPIPGNDDAIRAVGLFCRIMADAVMEGRMHREKMKEEEDQKSGASEGREAGEAVAEAAPEMAPEAVPEAEVAADVPEEPTAEADVEAPAEAEEVAASEPEAGESE